MTTRKVFGKRQSRAEVVQPQDVSHLLFPSLSSQKERANKGSFTIVETEMGKSIFVYEGKGCQRKGKAREKSWKGLRGK